MWVPIPIPPCPISLPKPFLVFLLFPQGTSLLTAVGLPACGQKESCDCRRGEFFEGHIWACLSPYLFGLLLASLLLGEKL